MFSIFAGHCEHRQNTQAKFVDFFGWCNNKKEGIFLRVDPFKEKTKNQHRNLHLDPHRAGCMGKPDR